MIRLLLFAAAVPFVVSATVAVLLARRCLPGVRHCHRLDFDLSAYLVVPSCACGAVLFDADVWVTIPDSPAGVR